MSEINHDADEVRRVLAGEGIEVPEPERKSLRIVEPNEVPRCELPGGGRNISTFGRDLGRLLRDTGAFFRRDGEVVAVDLEAKALVPVSARAFRGDVEQHVVFYEAKYARGSVYEQVETMGMETAATVLSIEAFKGELHEVTRIHDQRLPVLRCDGRIERLEPGLDVEAKVFTLPGALDYRMDMPIEMARKVWRDTHSEFPFIDWSREGWQEGQSRSFAVHTAAAMSQFAWCLVGDVANRLSFMFHSNSERSGKSLLAEIALVLTHGMIATSSWKKDEEKMAAMLDVIVRNRAAYAFFDNLKGHVASEELEGFLTGGARKVRLFHTQIERVFPNRTSCFITGNSLTWSKDIDGRVLICDLYLEDADPQARRVRVERTRSDFLLPGLRGDLLSAMWAMVMEWDRLKRPAPGRIRAGFGEWCRVIGGVVACQGFGDPLLPRPDEMSGGNTDFADMLALVERLSAGVQTVAEYRFEDVVEAAMAVNAFEWLMKGKEKRVEEKVSFVLDPAERRKFADILSSTYGGRTFSLSDGRRVQWGNRGKNRGRWYQVIVKAAAQAS
jgi:hypothetical protein